MPRPPEPSPPEPSPREPSPREPGGTKTAALILAAGASRRMGRPKQLLPYGDGVLLDAILRTARAANFDQIVLALGGAADQVRQVVDTAGCDLVENTEYGAGCSSSIAAALPALHPDTDVLVLLLADQPETGADSIRRLLEGRGSSGIAVCRYDDGVGHPFAFGRTFFPRLAGLHGDKAVWKLLEQQRHEHPEDVADVPVPGRIPPDVDTPEDYVAALEALDQRQRARAGTAPASAASAGITLDGPR